MKAIILILKIVVFTLFFVTPFFVFGQNDAKQKDWKNSQPYKSQKDLDHYYSDFIDEYQNWDYLEQEAYLKQGEKAALALNDNTLAPEFNYQLGNLYLSVDSLSKAIFTLNASLAYNSDEVSKAETYNLIGFTYAQLEDYPTAFEYYFKAVDLRKKHKPEGLYPIFVNISTTYENLEDHENAIKYNWYANGVGRKLSFPSKEYVFLFNYVGLSKIYGKLNQLDSVKHYTTAALETLQKVDSVRSYSMQEAKKMTLIRVIKAYLLLDMLEEAKYYLQKVKDYEFTHYKFSVIMLEAEYEMKLGRYQNALNIFENTDLGKIYLSLTDKEYLLEQKINCYEKLGNSAAVIEMYQALIENKSQKFKEDRVKASTLADIKYETLKKNEQIQALQLNQKINTAIIVSAIIILCLLAGWSFYIYRNNQQRKAQNQLLLANQQTIATQSAELKVLYDYKNKLFANIAHELRTPLTLISNPIKSVLKRNEIQKQDAEQLRIADRNVRTLSSTIHQILDLAKRDNVKLTIQPIQFDVNELVQFIANDFHSMAQFKSIQFTQPMVGLKMPVITDGEKLMIVIRNLLSNAFKFTSQNGQVGINIIDLGEEITINVLDTGKGIQPADLEKIFDRHFQVNPSNLPNEGGMGIGLSICKEYMTLLKGTITAESELGKGSSFTIRFPKQLVEKSNINEEASNIFNALITQQPTLNIDEKIEKLRPITHDNTDEITKILIVEDNIDMSNYLNTILSEEYELSFAQNGKQALRQFQNSRPDLIISDYMMPNMNGIELIEQLKNQPEYAGIPVIMLTAQQAMEVKLNALRIGVDDYLTKPFDNRELLARVNNILTNQRIIKAEIQSEAQAANPTEEKETPPTMNLEDLAWLEELENKAKLYISNPDFTIVQLAEEMAVSYYNIFRKIKKMTGLTANQYLREVRFQEALKLLEAKKYGSVKAVSYSVGYKNVKYFSKNFKKRFGKSPSEYLG